MVSAIDSAVSGLNAASTRLAVSANNVANAFTPNYVPQQVDQISLSAGGVQALVTGVNPATTTVADPTSSTGTTQLPNVDLGNELVGQSVTSLAYEANLKTIEVANKTMQDLMNALNIVA